MTQQQNKAQVERGLITLPGSEAIALDRVYPMPEGGTEREDSDLYLQAQLAGYFHRLVHASADEIFVDGMESAFSQGITVAVETYGNIAVDAIKRLINLDCTNVEIIGEILRQIGSIEDSRTHHSRLTTLMSNLKSSDPRIRDAASLGLATLDDPAAIEGIQEAFDREIAPQLKQNLALVLNQLQATQWQTS